MIKLKEINKRIVFLRLLVVIGIAAFIYFEIVNKDLLSSAILSPFKDNLVALAAIVLVLFPVYFILGKQLIKYYQQQEHKILASLSRIELIVKTIIFVFFVIFILLFVLSKLLQTPL